MLFPNALFRVCCSPFNNRNVLAIEGNGSLSVAPFDGLAGYQLPAHRWGVSFDGDSHSTAFRTVIEYSEVSVTEPLDKGLMDPAYYHWKASLIWGENLKNVKIYGPGTLQGAALTRSSKVKKGTPDKGIALNLCKNVEIRNLNIAKGGHYAILAAGCEDMLIDNVTINTGRDGLNLSQCKDVLIANCHIDAVRYEDGRPAGGGDAIKLGSDLSLGNAQNITVRNCFLASGCNTPQFGKENIGSFKNIRFENIRILRAGKAGISFTSNDGSTFVNQP